MRAGSNWRHLNGLSLGMMGDPVQCLPKVVHLDVAALKLQHNPQETVYTITSTGTGPEVSAKFTHHSPKERDESLRELRQETEEKIASFCKRLSEHLSVTPR